MNRNAHAVLALLSIAVAAYAIAAYALLPLGAVLHPDLRSSFAAHRHAVIYLHVFGAAVALLLGPIQFWTRWRVRWPALHRWLGSTYLALGVGVGGLSGLVLALDAFGGAWSRAGFGALAVLWIATGAMALQRILQGDVQGHRRWMVRNFALAFAAVTLRLYLPAGLVSGLSLQAAYPIVAWLCWVPNLVVAECLIHRATLTSTATQRVPTSSFSTGCEAPARCSRATSAGVSPAPPARYRAV
ncbi:MAG: DUF2306 domain-containing protein [Rubrivivax sp.]